MECGLFFEWPNPELRNWQNLFDEAAEQIRLSEDLGFGSPVIQPDGELQLD